MSVDKIIATLPGKSETERTKMRANAERLLVSESEAKKAAARKLLDALGAQSDAEHKALYNRLVSMPVSARVVEAFRKLPPTETDEKVVRVLLEHPGSTSTQLSRALGWGGRAWHAHFGKMCRNREVYLWPAETYGKHDTNFYSGILANFDGDGRFTMKPDVAGAFVELGIAPAHQTKAGP